MFSTNYPIIINNPHSITFLIVEYITVKFLSLSQYNRLVTLDPISCNFDLLCYRYVKDTVTSHLWRKETEGKKKNPLLIHIKLRTNICFLHFIKGMVG